jgi:hypothetical protein
VVQQSELRRARSAREITIFAREAGISAAQTSPRIVVVAEKALINAGVCLQKKRRKAGFAERPWRVAVEAAVSAFEAGRIGQIAEKTILARSEAAASRQRREEADRTRQAEGLVQAVRARGQTR